MNLTQNFDDKPMFNYLVFRDNELHGLEELSFVDEVERNPYKDYAFYRELQSGVA